MNWLKKGVVATAMLAALGFGGMSIGCEESNEAVDAVGDAASDAEDGAKSEYGKVVETAEGVMKDAEEAGKDAMDAAKGAAE